MIDYGFTALETIVINHMASTFGHLEARYKVESDCLDYIKC